MLGFASIYQIPMVGSDICGFGGTTTEKLCARWATLGAFNPFYRNHNQDDSPPQEFYRWALVTQAAKNAIDIRYRLLDYFYTAFHQAHVDGTPVLQPLWFQYPFDHNTYGIDMQFFFGDAVLVSPVVDDESTSVNVYLPEDIFYDFKTFVPVSGTGSTISLTNVNFTEIPLHIRGGSILPLRVESAYTTTDLRKKDFELVIAPGKDGKARGQLYVDDGISIQQDSILEAKYTFSAGKLDVHSQGSFDAGSIKYEKARVLGVSNSPSAVSLNGQKLNKDQFIYDSRSQSLLVTIQLPLSSSFTMKYV